jgi:osmoprotectant transport system permease protein
VSRAALLSGALLVTAGLALPAGAPREARAAVVVGSKAFPESWILGEALATLVRDEGADEVTHRHNLGGTEIVFQALRSGEIDVYPEYTGTIQEVILRSPGRLGFQEMEDRLRAMGFSVSDPIGFNDSYAIAVTREAARRYGLATLSDLARHPEVRLGLTHEFLGRQDGFPGLARAYGLDRKRVVGIEHELAYAALESGTIDGTDIYTTDAQIARLGLVVLRDDRRFFPRYDAVWLFRSDLAAREPAALRAVRRLSHVVDEARMIRANARVVLEKHSFHAAADTLLLESLGRSPGVRAAGGGRLHAIGRNTVRHLELVGFSLLAAILIGVPLGVVAAGSRFLGGGILGLVGALQTIPSLALLAFLIPILGIGVVPALAALFLYSLLPIVRNTVVGLTTVPAPLPEVAESIGLSARARLFRVRLPLASPAILAGIKTSAVINIGSATLAALIGAGGLGEPILSGIQLRQNGLILEGAIPAAILALLAQRGFDLLDRVAVPRGLRLSREKAHDHVPRGTNRP